MAYFYFVAFFNSSSHARTHLLSFEKKPFRLEIATSKRLQVFLAFSRKSKVETENEKILVAEKLENKMWWTGIVVIFILPLIQAEGEHNKDILGRVVVTQLAEELLLTSDHFGTERVIMKRF